MAKKRVAAAKAATPTDIVEFTDELTALFEKYNGRLWRVSSAARIAGAVRTVSFLLLTLLPQR